jgi:hypothetical protein
MHNASPELFDFLNIPPAHKRRVPAGFWWLIRKARHFSFFVFFSLVAHLALFGIVIILSPKGIGPPSPAAVQARDFQMFRESLQEYAVDGYTPHRLANALTALTEEDIQEAFVKAPELDDRLTEREKTGLYKRMIAEAMADFKEGAGERSALDLPLNQYFKSLREMPLTDPSEDFSLVPIHNALDESARLFRLSKEKAETIESLSHLTKEPQDRPREVKLQGDEGYILSVPGEYFYRDSPYLQIVAVGAKLFYVIKSFPELPVTETSQDKAGGLPQDAPKNLLRNELSPNFNVVFIPSYRPHTPAPRPITALPSLVLPPEEAEQVLDSLMALPVEEQVRMFNRDYLQTYDPDSPDLAFLTKAFIYKNLGMVFILTNDPLSRGFDFLEELYYDNLSLDEFVHYALKNPGSRTGAAILLCLAASYEFERRVIIALDGSLDAAKQVLANPSDDRFFVHNKNVKAYVLREVYRDLAAELRNRNFPSLRSVIQKYRDEQLRIYDLLTGMGGDVKRLAQYALGRLYWDEGQADLAQETWKSIYPVFSNWTLTKIRQAMTDSRNPARVISEIGYILDADAASDRTRLLERIEKFNKWKKR